MFAKFLAGLVFLYYSLQLELFSHYVTERGRQRRVHLLSGLVLVRPLDDVCTSSQVVPLHKALRKERYVWENKNKPKRKDCSRLITHSFTEVPIWCGRPSFCTVSKWVWN